MRIVLLLAFLLFTLRSMAQAPSLTVADIMRDPKWIGSSPSELKWSADSKTLYFLWNPDQQEADSLYAISPGDRKPRKTSIAERRDLPSAPVVQYNAARTAYTFARDGDLYYHDLRNGKSTRILNTAAAEFNPAFVCSDTKILYTRDQNLYTWTIASGETEQLTQFETGSGAGRPASRPAAPKKSSPPDQETWLQEDQIRYFSVLRERKLKREQLEAYSRVLENPSSHKKIPLQDKTVSGLSASPDCRWISYRLNRIATQKSTIVPSYVTESGFTTDIPARPKVGSTQSSAELYFYDRIRDTVFQISTDSLPGITDQPAYLTEYTKNDTSKGKKKFARELSYFGPYWSPSGVHALLDIRSRDNKDRWLAVVDPESGRLKVVDRQRDEAWIGGPGIGFGRPGWIDDQTIWFLSEASGYAHIYTVDTRSGDRRTVTSGAYEILQAQVLNDKKHFLVVTNEVHPGEQHVYQIRIADGKKQRLTFSTGAYQSFLSPDEKHLALLYSTPNNPWELYLMENKAGAKAVQVTDKARSAEFAAYPWREPELIRFPARDGAGVYARVYRPSKPDPKKPAVIFVHGAGYLQNAHKWWSSYFREYMFHNLLADHGYHVMDIDYRGSAGYGRDWRTGIYRHMGGKDLTDHVDAAQYMVKEFGVDPKRIGIYGGSYGGFITLMAMFTQPGVFAAGAALRPVTDWAQYNHGYTSNILNEPFTDSLAYRRSSPLYFAEGLQGHLLICHGMIDVNVHYQDAVKLTQRLIELGKDNWELASYPLEDHGFVEPSSWTDEYKRIYQLFERVLKAPGVKP